MWIQAVMLLGISAVITFYFLNQYEQSKKLPSPKNVLQLMQKLQPSEKKFGKASEKQIEQWLAKKMRHYFDDVETQISMGGREKIDLDVGNGKVGIELKLARKLKSRNEVNRLIGQTTMYKNRKYNQNNLIILLVENTQTYEQPHVQELKQIIEKEALFFYMKLT
ncbi:hypothetical protein [Microscilla marina]|uniref:Restriction endonuclease type IV Mrr domain-containing protein n=1 Tax=Microscilla marina ATCC 23134 TaxID=313606 RepID=A1ZR88_MICM2|nr:hypothetical protein [Microscilla marina]EAY27177.1 hypothetical protein M23134_08451 [Microscilla marina ATCC 23134]